MQTLYETEISPDELDLASMTREELVEEFQEDARDAYEAKVEEYGPELMREVERYLVLQVVDTRWREHLESMEYMRDGIHLRAMAQKDPLSEYRSEGHAMFEELTRTIQEEVVRYLLRIQIEKPPEEGELEPAPSPPDGAGNGGLDLRARLRRRLGRHSRRRGGRGRGRRRRGGRARPRARRPARRRPSPPASASSRPRSGSGGTTRARAARARSTRSATAPSAVALSSHAVVPA